MHVVSSPLQGARAREAAKGEKKKKSKGEKPKRGKAGSRETDPRQKDRSELPTDFISPKAFRGRSASA
jgi:hypothetical protein